MARRRLHGRATNDQCETEPALWPDRWKGRRQAGSGPTVTDAGPERTSPMGQALVEAKAAADRGEVPVGAVITNSLGEIIAADGNRMRELCDPTAHAEMLVIREAARQCGEIRLTAYDLYVTLEPCPMCAQAISLARIRRLYYGAADPKGGAVDHGPRLFAATSCHHRPDVYDGIGERQSAALLRTFFRQRR